MLRLRPETVLQQSTIEISDKVRQLLMITVHN